MISSDSNRFQDFFEQSNYVALKNYLYSYLLRKYAVEARINNNDIETVLEVGSGISPVLTNTDRIIYSDLSFTALKILKHMHGKGIYVVADGMNLPFKHSVFSHTICSEVLEHISDDKKAIKELARVMKPSGSFILTFPHRKAYFANDDRFVEHLRRYDLFEMEEMLKQAGFTPVDIQKVLGPLDKATICLVIFFLSIIQKKIKKNKKRKKIFRLINIIVPFFILFNRFYTCITWLDARIMPRAFSTVLLINSKMSDNIGRKRGGR